MTDELVILQISDLHIGKCFAERTGRTKHPAKEVSSQSHAVDQALKLAPSGLLRLISFCNCSRFSLM